MIRFRMGDEDWGLLGEERSFIIGPVQSGKVHPVYHCGTLDDLLTALRDHLVIRHMNTEAMSINELLQTVRKADAAVQHFFAGLQKKAKAIVKNEAETVATLKAAMSVGDRDSRLFVGLSPVPSVSKQT